MRIEEKNKLVGESLTEEIGAACNGLIYISETDAPVRPVFVEKTDVETIEDTIVRLSGIQTGKFSERSANEFFARLIQERDWHREAEKESVIGFRKLKDLLFGKLTGLREYRLGKTRIKIFVVGLDAAGNVAGISTESVET